MSSIRLGDGMNVNDISYRTTSSCMANLQSGRDRGHIEPAEARCTMRWGPPALLERATNAKEQLRGR